MTDRSSNARGDGDEAADGDAAQRAPSEREPPAKRQKREERQVEERSGLRTPVIYEIVRKRGDEEMARPATSLWWSGVAAGLSMSFSLLTQAILFTHLPDSSWRSLAVSVGYPVGFLIVILGRQQLFTENTITAVLPVMKAFTVRNLGRLLRMWAIVWIANTVGTLFAAYFCTLTPVITPELRDGMLEVSAAVMRNGWAAMFFKAISAGFLVAATVWLIPSAEAAQFWVISLFTFLIGAGGFAHIVAGSVEGFMLVANGRLDLLSMIVDFVVPTLLGNIVGGTALFALISYAQVMDEI
ncbi:MAG TPA: formate/nitrite transporter family protein [Casimicrobiaceae bacterium]|nr:formate/nitrite transporter family protein [Casimicrobiaceae bacterium]